MSVVAGIRSESCWQKAAGLSEARCRQQQLRAALGLTPPSAAVVVVAAVAALKAAAAATAAARLLLLAASPLPASAPCRQLPAAKAAQEARGDSASLLQATRTRKLQQQWHVLLTA